MTYHRNTQARAIAARSPAPSRDWALPLAGLLALGTLWVSTVARAQIPAPQGSPDPSATVQMVDAKGNAVGTVRVRQLPRTRPGRASPAA